MANASDSFFPFDEAVTLSNVSRIVGLMQRIKERRLMLNAKIEGVSGLFRTAILEINSKKNLIVLDELSPINGHELMDKGKDLYLSTILDGVDIHFPIRVEAIKKDSKGAMYHAALPDKLIYRQRRRHFRVQLQADLALKIHLQPEGASAIHGHLSDISISGIGAIVLEPDENFHPHPGDKIPCRIQLFEDTLDTSIEVRFVAQMEKEDGLRLGAKFIDADQNQQRIMERIVTQLQREQLKRR